MLQRSTVCVLWAMSLPAFAGPVPDRPAVLSGARLVEAETIELEAGGHWTEHQSRVPALVKYGVNSNLEPRLGLDLAGVGAGHPGLSAGLKIGILDKREIAVGALVWSAVPLAEGEPWRASVRGLADWGLASGVGLGFNTGIDLVGGGAPVAVAGVPLVGQVSVPILRPLRAYAEASTLLSDHFGAWVFDAGLRYRVTSIASLDAGAGYELDTERPFVQLGATVNIGRPGGD